MYDLIIVGSGPAGLAAAVRARYHGLDYLVLEREAIANTVYRYPIGDVLFSSSDEIEIEAGSLPIHRKPTREELLRHYRLLVIRHEINLRTREEVYDLVNANGHIFVRTRDGAYRARAVLAATGRFGRRRILNVPIKNAILVGGRVVDYLVSNVVEERLACTA